MIVTGRVLEIVGDDQPVEWQYLEWLSCDCGSITFAPRNQQGYVGKWALCADITCRKLWKLSQSGNDVVGSLDGVMPQEFHARLIGI